MAENAMMVLAPAIGRTRPHDLVHHAVAEAFMAAGGRMANGEGVLRTGGGGSQETAT